MRDTGRTDLTHSRRHIVCAKQLAAAPAAWVITLAVRTNRFVLNATPYVIETNVWVLPFATKQLHTFTVIATERLPSKCARRMLSQKIHIKISVLTQAFILRWTRAVIALVCSDERFDCLLALAIKVAAHKGLEAHTTNEFFPCLFHIFRYSPRYSANSLCH